MDTNQQSTLNKVYLASDVQLVLLQHALINEKEEIMGLLIGQVDEDSKTSNIHACMILQRSDKQPDRVEISPEQLCKASSYADELAKKLEKPMRVLGWYHSHPHITVDPSHVDICTQFMYQLLDPFFVGLIFSVYQNDNATKGNTIQMTCFQTNKTSGNLEKRAVPITVLNTPIAEFNLQEMANLSKILSDEEFDRERQNANNDYDDKLADLHNDTYKAFELINIISKVSLPALECLENRLTATKLRIKELEEIKKNLLEK